MEHSERPEDVGRAKPPIGECNKKEYGKPELTVHDDLMSVTGLAPTS
jgi:hypothetical protein